MDHIVELHVAGGMERDGFYLDSHSGAIAEPIWQLLEWILPQCSNLRGVTFELMGSWYPTVGADRLGEDLTRLRAIWQHHQAHRPPVPA